MNVTGPGLKMKQRGKKEKDAEGAMMMVEGFIKKASQDKSQPAFNFNPAKLFLRSEPCQIFCAVKFVISIV